MWKNCKKYSIIKKEIVIRNSSNSFVQHELIYEPAAVIYKKKGHWQQSLLKRKC